VYYQEAFNFVPNEAIAISEFFSSHSDRTFVLDGSPRPAPIWVLYGEPEPFTDLPYYSIYPATFDVFSGRNASFAVFDPVARLWHVQGHGVNIIEYYEGQQAKYSLAYDNGFGTIYLLYSPP